MINHTVDNMNIDNLNYLRIYSKYKLLALNMFEWENLPKGLHSRHIEKALYDYGQGTMFYDNKKEKYIFLPSSNSEKFNVYNEALQVVVTGMNYQENILLIEEKNELEELDIIKGVRCMNNDLMLSTHLFVQDYSTKMYEVEKAINMNVRQQKFPYFVKCDTNSELTMRKLFEEIEEGLDIKIFGSKNMELDNIEVLNINSPYVVDKLNEYKYDLEREILTFLSLNNTVEKKERLLVDEINSNNDYIEEFGKLMEKSRLEFVETFNKVFGENISVKRKNFVNKPTVELGLTKGGDED